MRGLAELDRVSLVEQTAKRKGSSQVSCNKHCKDSSVVMWPLPNDLTFAIFVEIEKNV